MLLAPCYQAASQHFYGTTYTYINSQKINSLIGCFIYFWLDFISNVSSQESIAEKNGEKNV